MITEINKSPIVIYLIIAVVSACSSLLFFHVGGSIAEMTGNINYGFSFKTGGALAGFLIVFYSSLYVIERLNKIESTPEKDILPDSYSFAAVISEISETINRLEKNGNKLVRIYISKKEGERLFEGLYSSLLYVSSAVITGKIDSRFYGNMMEWKNSEQKLKVRYFSGPYNDEIITREFPIEGPGQGVASEALKQNQIQIKNRMESELKEKGEARLSSMIAVPIETKQDIDSRQIVILNIDAGMEGVFPTSEEFVTAGVKSRLEQLASLISRVNTLFRNEMEWNILESQLFSENQNNS